MIKVIILSVLLASVFAHKLTPGTKLPHSLDNMIHNNLGGSIPESQVNLKAVHRTSNDITTISIPHIQDYITSELPWINIQSANFIAFSATKLAEERVESHYVFEATPQDSSFRYALINIAHSKTGLKILISQESTNAFGIQRKSIFHEVKSSLFGLPFDKEEVVIRLNSDNNEIHQFNRNRLMAGLKEVRGTQRTDMLAAFDLAKTLNSAGNVVDQIAKSWKSLTEAFKTVQNEELKQVMNGKGYESLSSKSRFIRNLGIPKDRVIIYTQLLMKLVGGDSQPEIKKLLMESLSSATLVAVDEWIPREFTFAVDTLGNCNSVMALSKYDMIDNLIHIFAIVVDGSFKLAPNIYIYENYLSAAEGIYESRKPVTKNVPKTITDKDIKGIQHLIMLTAIDGLGKEMKRAFRIPSTF